MEKDLSKSFIRSLCMGKVEEDILFPYPKMKKSDQETVNMIRDSLKTWLGGRDEEFRKWDAEGEFPTSFIQEIKEMGLFGLIVPEKYGGLELSPMGYARTLQEISRYDASLALTVGAHSSIGMRGVLLHGNEDQQKKYFPRLATGELLSCFCLTEPGAGSDAASLKTVARKEENHWVVNGEKIWITNGGWANFFTVFAKSETSKGKITAFLITSEMDGVSVGPHEDKMGIRASSTTSVRFDNVKVPFENVLGEEGKGFKVAMSILNSGRIGLGGGCVGAMKLLMELCADHATNRKQFGQPIGEFGLMKQKLGHMMVETYAAESVVNMVCGVIEAGYKDYAVEAAISKVFTTEVLWRIADEAMQVSGGTGYMKELPYERVLRNCRINRIFEGTNEILTLFVALTAMKDVGEMLKDVLKSTQNFLSDPIKGFGVLSEYAIKKVSDTTKVGRPKLTKFPACLQEFAGVFDAECAKLTLAVDQILRKHGKNVFNKQFATKRLANIMIDLYVFASVLSRVTSSIEENGEEASKWEIEILKVFCGQAQRRIRSNYKKIDKNDDDSYIELADLLMRDGAYKWDAY